MDHELIPLDRPLSPLAQAVVAGCPAPAVGHAVPAIKDPAALNGAVGLELRPGTIGHLWPELTLSTSA